MKKLTYVRHILKIDHIYVKFVGVNFVTFLDNDFFFTLEGYHEMPFSSELHIF